MKYVDVKQLKFIMYLRKSSDSEDKQIASIPQQKKELAEIAKRDGLNVLATVVETRSAFSPGRPKFNNEVIDRINRGEANAA